MLLYIVTIVILQFQLINKQRDSVLGRQSEVLNLLRCALLPVVINAVTFGSSRLTVNVVVIGSILMGTLPIVIIVIIIIIIRVISAVIR